MRIRKTMCAILSGLLLLCMAGCRPSMTFTEIVYDQTVDQIMEQARLDQLDNDTDNEEKDDSITSVEDDDEADTERGRQREEPSPGNGESTRSAPKAKQDTTLMQNFRGDTPKQTGDTNTDRTVPQGTGTENGDGTQNGTPAAEGSGSDSGGESGGSGGGSGGSGAEGAGGGQYAGGNPGGEEAQGGTGESGDDVLREIVDANGRVVTIPSNVQSLAAAGELAVLVEMLGGGEKMTASSASLKEGLAGRLFGSGWSGSVLWDGDGGSPMSDDDFAQLLVESPQLCMIQSGKVSFTEDQLRQLQENGIEYMTLPALTGSSRICEAVRLAGEVLQAQDKAEEYIRYCDDMKNDMRSLAGIFRPDGIDYDTGDSGLETGSGVYALYISGWDPSAYYSLHNENVVLEGQGMAVTETGYLNSPVSEMLSLAGIGNAAALAENNYSLSNVKIRFVNPIINNLCALDIKNGSQGATYKREYMMTTAGGAHLGDEEFPAVIAGTREAAAGIAGDGLWTAYPYGSSVSGNIEGYGFHDSVGNLVESTIHGPYTLCVVPSGAGSWREGSAESILLPYWAAWRVRGLCSEEDVRNKITDFYQRFYNVSLSDSDLQEILAGR